MAGNWQYLWLTSKAGITVFEIYFVVFVWFLRQDLSARGWSSLIVSVVDLFSRITWGWRFIKHENARF